MKPTNYTAYNNGIADGAAAVREQGAGAADVIAWFAPGEPAQNEGLVNALAPDELSRVLGITVADVEDRGDAWDIALESYDRGYRTGADAQAWAEKEDES
jgi:hypothetical protein